MAAQFEKLTKISSKQSIKRKDTAEIDAPNSSENESMDRRKFNNNDAKSNSDQKNDNLSEHLENSDVIKESNNEFSMSQQIQDSRIENQQADSIQIYDNSEKFEGTDILNSENCNNKTTNEKTIIKVPPYELFDFIFPGGIVTKMAKINRNAFCKDKEIQEILLKFQFNVPAPVIILGGCRYSNREKQFNGIARAAFRTDAVIIDSGLKTGIEKNCLRRDLKLIGVFPEFEVILPKINQVKEPENQLTNGRKI